MISLIRIAHLDSNRLTRIDFANPSSSGRVCTERGTWKLEKNFTVIHYLMKPSPLSISIEVKPKISLLENPQKQAVAAQKKYPILVGIPCKYKIIKVISRRDISLFKVAKVVSH